jgi:hypothetical protein
MHSAISTIESRSVFRHSGIATLARHEGTWDGIYRYYDAAGRQVDEHRSRLICRFPADQPGSYRQTNRYTWADGRTEVREFPALIRDGRLIWQGDLIRGWAADVALDEFARTSMLYWTRNNEPGVYVYEMIQLSDCGRYRARVWQWFRNGRLDQRTLIDEQKVSDRTDL